MLAKITAAVLSAGLAGSALSHGYAGHHQHHHSHHSSRWIGPVLGGLVLGSIIANAQRVQSAPAVIYAPQPRVELLPSQCMTTIYNPYTGTPENVLVSCHRPIQQY